MTTEDLPALAIYIARAQHLPNVAMLPDAAVIQIIGEDARQFLHAQWVSDVRSLDAAHGQLTAWCTAQGRVSFLLHLILVTTRFTRFCRRAKPRVWCSVYECSCCVRG